MRTCTVFTFGFSLVHCLYWFMLYFYFLSNLKMYFDILFVVIFVLFIFSQKEIVIYVVIFSCQELKFPVTR